MPSKTFPLSESSNVVLQWRGMWKDFTVTVDGHELGRMNGQREVSRGGTWTLANGSVLSVRLATGMAGGLEVALDGTPLPGSSSDPKTAMRTAAGIVFFLAGLNIVLGIVAELVPVELLLAMGLGWVTVGIGAVFAVLGLATHRGSVVALWIAIALFTLDGVLGLYATLEMGGSPPVGALVFRVFIIVAMVKSALAARGPTQ